MICQPAAIGRWCMREGGQRIAVKAAYNIRYVMLCYNIVLQLMLVFSILVVGKVR